MSRRPKAFYIAAAKIADIPAADIRIRAEIDSAGLVVKVRSVNAYHAQQHYLPAHFAESGYAVFEIPKLFSAPDALRIKLAEQRDTRIAVVFFKLKQNCLAGVLFEKALAHIYSICGGEVGGF